MSLLQLVKSEFQGNEVSFTEKTVKGGAKTDTRKSGIGQGTWLHPKLAVSFSQWLDTDFAVWCDEQIDAILEDDCNK